MVEWLKSMFSRVAATECDSCRPYREPPTLPLRGEPGDQDGPRMIMAPCVPCKGTGRVFRWSRAGRDKT